MVGKLNQSAALAVENYDPFAGKTVSTILVFEGGGAKGIAHLGALAALEQLRAENRDDKYRHLPRHAIRAVSGTSIGALVASLVAVGFSSNDLLPQPTNTRGIGAKILIWFQQGIRLHYGRLIAVVSVAMLLFYLVLSFALPAQVSLSILWLGAFEFVLMLILAAWLTSSKSVRSLDRLLENWIAAKAVYSVPALDAAGLKNLSHVFGNARILLPVLRWSIINPAKAFAVIPLSFFLGMPVLLYLFGIVGPSVFLLSIVFLLLAIFFSMGLFSTEKLANSIDKALAHKLCQVHERMLGGEISPLDKQLLEKDLSECQNAIKACRINYKRVVTFSMLSRAKAAPLSVIATNVTEAKASVFSTDSTPSVLVAEAVAASMSFPVLFKPSKIKGYDGHVFFDGGVTSNLPAWPYDTQRKINPDVYTLTIEMIRSPLNRSADRGYQFFSRIYNIIDLFHATLFGARELERRRTRSVRLQIPTMVTLLDIRMSARQALAHAADARNVTLLWLVNRASERQLYESVCRNVAALVKEVGAGLGQDKNFRIRVSLLQETSLGARALKTKWRYSSCERPNIDTDDRLVYRKGSSVPGLAWDRWKPVLANVEGDKSRIIWWTHRDSLSELYPPNGDDARHRYSLRLMWDEIEWCLAVPMAQVQGCPRASKDFVVLVDTNIPLFHFNFKTLEDHSARQLALNIAEICSRLWDVSKATSEGFRDAVRSGENHG